MESGSSKLLQKSNCSKELNFLVVKMLKAVFANFLFKMEIFCFIFLNDKRLVDKDRFEDIFRATNGSTLWEYLRIYAM